MKHGALAPRFWQAASRMKTSPVKGSALRRAHVPSLSRDGFRRIATIAGVNLGTVGLIVGIELAGSSQPPLAAQAERVAATRLPRNPLITLNSSKSLGDNVNGPSVVRVPAWVRQPLGRYYMYFAHHKGEFIRLAYADALEGPWRIYEPGVLHVRDSAFYRPQPDPPDSPEGFYTHVASPEIHVDAARNKIVMWFHGWFTNSQRWPVESVAAARGWTRENGFGQFTQVAESSDGIHFDIHQMVAKESYLRVFRDGATFYGLARLGVLLRSKDPLSAFEVGPNPFRDGPYAGRVRHVALLRRGRTLNIFFSAIGDAPERILVASLNVTGGWESWKTSATLEVLQPQAEYECPNLPIAPSEAGDVEGRVRQMRDPAVFEEGGRAWLFYTICGEQGIAAAELHI